MLLVRRDDVYLALLTGNYEDAARIKLEYFDLWRYFRCGAFGDDAPDRNGLLPKAMAAIRECGGPEVAPLEIVVVGDTPLDVACAAASGARSLAVATGGYDVDALRAAGADVVLQDLTRRSRDADRRSWRRPRRLAADWRKRLGVEPSLRVSRERPVLKTGRATGPRSLRI